MNRRSFFKTITGFVGGVVAAFVPGKKKVIWAAPIEGVQKRKGTEYPTPSSAGWSANEWAEAHNNTVAEIEREFELRDIERRVNLAFVFKPSEWTNSQVYPLGTRFGKYTYVKKVKTKLG